MRPMLGVYSVLLRPHNGTLFPMASGENQSWEQYQR
jgi:hypothetical protein